MCYQHKILVLCDPRSALALIQNRKSCMLGLTSAEPCGCHCSVIFPEEVYHLMSGLNLILWLLCLCPEQVSPHGNRRELFKLLLHSVWVRDFSSTCSWLGLAPVHETDRLVLCGTQNDWLRFPSLLQRLSSFCTS